MSGGIGGVKTPNLNKLPDPGMRMARMYTEPSFTLDHRLRPSSRSMATEIGAWGGREFARVIQRHEKRKDKDPDSPPAVGTPYDGIENLRPESKAAVEAFLLKQKAASH